VNIAGQADPNWPNRTGYSIPYAILLCSRWGAGRGEGSCGSECLGHQAVRVALCILLFVLYTLLISIVVVTVCFIRCSVKLPLSQPMSFCLFLSILPPTLAGREVKKRPRGPLSPAMAKLQHLILCLTWGGDNGNNEQSMLKQLS